MDSVVDPVVDLVAESFVDSFVESAAAKVAGYNFLLAWPVKLVHNCVFVEIVEVVEVVACVQLAYPVGVVNVVVLEIVRRRSDW